MAKPESTEARRGDLALCLSVQAAGSTVTAEATLTNEGQNPWEYTLFGTVPLLLVQARDQKGNEVYRYHPGIRSYMVRLMQLAPGAGTSDQVQFSAHGVVYVWAYLSNNEDFRTDEVRVIG